MSKKENVQLLRVARIWRNHYGRYIVLVRAGKKLFRRRVLDELAGYCDGGGAAAALE